MTNKERAALLAELGRILARLGVLPPPNSQDTAYSRAMSALGELETRLHNDRAYLGKLQGSYRGIPHSAGLLDTAERLEARYITHIGLVWLAQGELAANSPARTAPQEGEDR